jgi:LacI family transcriptional regulator
LSRFQNPVRTKLRFGETGLWKSDLKMDFKTATNEKCMTVKEIAELAKVSIGTVDRVIYNRGRVAAEIKARIEAIIEKHQFTPNPIARLLKQNRAYRFWAFLPRRDQDAGYWGQALEGIQEGADEIAPLGLKRKLSNITVTVPGTCKSIHRFIEKKPDGIMLVKKGSRFPLMK